VAFCNLTKDYKDKSIFLVENTPEEIRDVVFEMEDRLNGTWQPQDTDEHLQQQFLKRYPTNELDGCGRPRHGEIRSRFGASYLRKNHEWIK
jgi:hypothetical protein